MHAIQTNLNSRRLFVSLAECPRAIEESQRLRYRVFVEEMGASVPEQGTGIERDAFDRWCDHLLVRDRQSGAVIASTRVLSDRRARLAGGFYSAGEFDMGSILKLPGRLMEVGRTCVHPAWRNGAAVAVLWQGLGEYIQAAGFDYVIGCASIPLHDGGAEAAAVMNYLRDHHLVPEALRVRPRRALAIASAAADFRLPPLLRSYLSLGSKVGGEAYWDKDFGVADVFVLLDVRRLSPRYARHFLGAGRRLQHVAAA